MSTNFKISARKVNGNLHLELSGDFDGSSAWELANTIMLKYNREPQVIINTEKIGKIVPFGSALFENLMKTRMLPADKMIFEGTKGAAIKHLRQDVFFADGRRRKYSGSRRCVSRCSIV